MDTRDRIYLAFDGMDYVRVAYFISPTLGVERMSSSGKIHALYDECGIPAIHLIKEGGLRVWVDYKLHDIPITVGFRAGKLFAAGADIVTVMAQGGVKMMEAAVKAAENHSAEAKVYAVSVPTSLTNEEVWAMANLQSVLRLKPGESVMIDHSQYLSDLVVHYARLAAQAGVHGFVCSGQEAGRVSALPEMKGRDVVTPGTRLPGSKAGDQKRIVTPKEAILAGATHLVIGSEVTQSPDPIAVLEQIHQEIEAGLAERV